MRERKDILVDLIHKRQDMSVLIQELSIYPWDCDEPLVIMKRDDILNILNTYVSGDLSSDELENWANAIECREDIGFEDDTIEDIVNRIANPVLYGTNSIDKIKAIMTNIVTNN
jgi:hypothetical protein